MQFAYHHPSVKEVPSLGADNSKAYGYAQDHHTLELHLKLWVAHTNDVVQLGTPPPCRRLIDLVFSFWNKCMGNVDVVRKVLRRRRAWRGPDSGPGSLMWCVLLGYALYDAFRLYQHGQLEGQLDEIVSFKQFQKARQKICTFSKYLYKLANGGCFEEQHLAGFFPGLKEFINHGSKKAPEELSVNAGLSLIPEENIRRPSGYKLIVEFLKPGTELYRVRLDTTKSHKSVSLKIDNAPNIRGRCVVCCEICAKGKCHVSAHVRSGRKTVRYCLDCGVMLCKHCHVLFHTEKFPLPACHACQPPGLMPLRSRASAVTPPPAPNMNRAGQYWQRGPSTTKSSLSRQAASGMTTAPKSVCRLAEAANITSPARKPRTKKNKNATTGPPSPRRAKGRARKLPTKNNKNGSGARPFIRRTRAASKSMEEV